MSEKLFKVWPPRGMKKSSGFGRRSGCTSRIIKFKKENGGKKRTTELWKSNSNSLHESVLTVMEKSSQPKKRDERPGTDENRLMVVD